MDLDARYAAIAGAQGAQQANYAAWLADSKGVVDGDVMVAQAAALGLALDLEGGQVSYAKGAAPLPSPPLCFDLLYVRHGKTTGNTEPRVYQGYVDEPSNALNDVGLAQAEEAADKLDGLGLNPDLVVLSPLARAKDTGLAWLRRHPELDDVTEVWETSHEMAFGDWDNRMVKDLPNDHIAHLFYLAQNAVVKASAPSPHLAPLLGPDKQVLPVVENFLDVLQRMRVLLTDVNARMSGLAAEREAERMSAKGGSSKHFPPPLVVMYGHSMAGAAIGVLTGNGKQVDGEAYLGFDGKYILPNATPVFLHRAHGDADLPF